jgi:hypothetical protein
VVAGECIPLVDVLETGRNVEIVLDLPGVASDALRIVIKSGVVLIVGEKERSEPSKRVPRKLSPGRARFRPVCARRPHSIADRRHGRSRMAESGRAADRHPACAGNAAAGRSIVPILSASESAGS